MTTKKQQETHPIKYKKEVKPKNENIVAPVANFIRAVGRRKTAVARVRLFKDGKGKIIVNGKDWKVYFPTTEQQFMVFNPLKLTGQTDKVDISVVVSGGGLTSQAGAVRHGISRALFKFNADFKAQLRKSGLLTRDSRKKERKKPGLKRARRAPQWKKR